MKILLVIFLIMMALLIGIIFGIWFSYNYLTRPETENNYQNDIEIKKVKTKGRNNAPKLYFPELPTNLILPNQQPEKKQRINFLTKWRERRKLKKVK